MSREKEGYREQLEDLYAVFGKESPLLPICKVAKYLHKDYRTLLENKKFPKKEIGNGKKSGRYVVNIQDLARWMLA